MLKNIFELKSNFAPAGDQPQAIAGLLKGIERGDQYQTLLGATGTGKTFTIANIIARLQRPALVVAHNKTLAAQLCNEFRDFFPDSSVNYFVSYYDYYQPEAYVPTTDTYIGKEAMINEEIDRLRHAATAALLTRRDVIVVASVSCIYGLGAPEVYKENIIHLAKGAEFDRAKFMRKLVELQYSRTTADLKRGTFRLRGETWEIMPPDRELVYIVEAKGGLIREIYEVDPVKGFQVGVTPELQQLVITPARHFITEPGARGDALKAIEEELRERVSYFEKESKFLEAERIEYRTKQDLAMMREIGYCGGIENYSRHLSGRVAGEPPASLLDYFPKDFLTVVDESHVTLPQLQGMHAGDTSRKKTLVDFGFRLPSAIDNRPLKFEEFQRRIGQAIFTSATPGHFELHESRQIVEQIIRPTGLVDPEVVIRPVRGQIDDLKTRIIERVSKQERVLVTTLTKRMAEDLTEYLLKEKMKVNYIHSDVKSLDRIRILTEFRRGVHEVLIGVNLLREGLDLPEVSLVAILDADKEGFLRSATSLIQTIGRAARNVNGQVVLYADNETGSIKRAVAETDRRRRKQLEYNKEHGITPKTIEKKIKDLTEGLDLRRKEIENVVRLELKAVPEESRASIIREKEKEMKEAAKRLDFELAAVLRDEVVVLKKQRGLLPKKVKN